MTSHGRALAAAIVISLTTAACQSAQVPLVPAEARSLEPAKAEPSPQGGGPASEGPMRGGCGATTVSSGPGPDAALGLADNPWAAATPETSGIIAYFWHGPPDVIYARGPNSGIATVLWISHGARADHLKIAARPLGAQSPVASFDVRPAASPLGGYQSTIDLPSAGCWHLELSLGATTATIDLSVAPAP